MIDSYWLNRTSDCVVHCLVDFGHNIAFRLAYTDDLCNLRNNLKLINACYTLPWLTSHEA